MMEFKELKSYQERCLGVLQDFFNKASVMGAKIAFIEITGRPYVTNALPDSLKGLPYVCLRVPTGGGKTLLAAHSIQRICKSYLKADTCVVLWLAPTNAIVDQTLSALQNRQHPYRKVLDEAFSSGVEVLRLRDALNISRGTLDGATTVIVSTLAALRVEETEGRKIYESSGDLEHHFSNLRAEQLDTLERADGVVQYSLANVLRLRRPLVIMDEAHNARTPLSFEALARFTPSAVIEFTATPDQIASPSNVLHSVSAAELKAAHMIKLPIRLRSRRSWREAVGAALSTQRRLETLAADEKQKTGEYIRPIVLFQAQPRNERGDSITVETLRSCLKEDFNISDTEIAEGTGKKWEVPDDLLEPSSNIRFVLTVAALREGWDCPFAYVLCSVSNLSSKTAVEQILGRVLRLPRVKRKQIEDLNLAYAFSTSDDFAKSAKSLSDALIEAGFSKFEAKNAIESDSESFDFEPGTLFQRGVAETFTSSPNLDALPSELKSRVTVTAQGEDKFKVSYSGPPLKPQEAEALRAAVHEADAKAVEKLTRRTWGHPTNPAALGETLAVPVLRIQHEGQLEIFEDQFRDSSWSLADRVAELIPDEFRATEPENPEADVDVDAAGKVQVAFIRELYEQLGFNDFRGPKTPAELAVWLDQSIDHPDITQTESGLFMLRTIEWLQNERHVSLVDLLKRRFSLRDAVEAKIEKYRQAALNASYQRLLGNPELFDVSDTAVFEFPKDDYPANIFYSGEFKYKKHYYECPGDMNGEEARCAVLIDNLDKVEFWVRNIERQQAHSFWLQTSTDKFYPDFVAILKDGKHWAIEYKGQRDINSDDTREKRRLGQLWEARSGGQCLFSLVGINDFQQVLSTLGA